MNGKKLIIAGAVIIFALAALLIASGIFILIVFDPLAIFNDGMGMGGLVVLVIFGPLLLALKIAMFAWPGAGIIYAFVGIAFVYRFAKKDLFRLRRLIRRYNFLSILISLLAFIVLFLFFEADVLFMPEAIPLTVTMVLAAILGITSYVLNSKILKII